MQTQSAAFKLAAAATVLYPVDRATLQTADGTTYDLGPGDIIAGSLSVNSSCFSDGIEIGSTVVAECSMGLNNADGRWDEIALEDAVLIPYSGLKLPDNSTEDFKLGTFIIDDPGYPYLQVTISASDRMLLLDEPFAAVTRAFPATNLQILQAISTYCNVPLASSITTILNASYSVTVRPTEDMTCRDVVGMIAMMAAGYARMNRNGELEIVQFPALAVDNTIDGNGNDTYTLDGLATDSLYDIGGTLFTDVFGYQGSALDMGVDSRYSFKQIREPVTVSGVQYNGTDNTTIIGADNYLLVVDNCPLIQSGADAVIQSIYDAMVGFTYTGFTAEYPGNPTIDLGDVVRHVTPDGKTILSLIASHTFAHAKRSTMEATAKSAKEKRYKASMTALLAAAAKEAADAALAAGTATSTANTAAGAAAAAAAAIAALAPLGLIEAAKLGETIMQGGYIKTILLDVATLIAGTLSNSATADFFMTPGDVTIDAVVYKGIFGFLRSYSATVPFFQILARYDAGTPNNHTLRIFLLDKIELFMRYSDTGMRIITLGGKYGTNEADMPSIGMVRSAGGIIKSVDFGSGNYGSGVDNIGGAYKKVGTTKTYL